MESLPVRVTADWSVPSGQTSAASVALQSLMAMTRAEPGCVGCSLRTQLGERTRFHYEEKWRTEEDLMQQLRSKRFASLAHLLESAIERPRVEFVLPGRVRGLDWAEQVRSQPEEPS